MLLRFVQFGAEFFGAVVVVGEACQVPVVDVPGHFAAGDADQEVSQLAKDVAQRQQGQLAPTLRLSHFSHDILHLLTANQTHKT